MLDVMQAVHAEGRVEAARGKGEVGAVLDDDGRVRQPVRCDRLARHPRVLGRQLGTDERPTEWCHEGKIHARAAAEVEHPLRSVEQRGEEPYEMLAKARRLERDASREPPLEAEQRPARASAREVVVEGPLLGGTRRTA